MSQLLDLWGKAACRDGDMAGSHADSGRRDEKVEGLEQVGQVGQGFTHPHEDQIIRSATGNPGGLDHLPDDFAGCQITTPTIDPAGAKTATIGATDLARNAQGEARAAVAGGAQGGWNEN